MKTSSWYRFKGPGRVGISAGNPRGMSAGYRIYKKLAPDKSWMHSALETYEPIYLAQLAQLDPKQVWDDLHRLAGDAEPVILCFEKPEPVGHGRAAFTRTNFCHRRMAARWMEDALGVTIPEWGFEGLDVDYDGFRQPAASNLLL